ncbi:MAG: class I tRNA ligase family protein, partial [Selenomonadaceae bacterium]|nr:class I tRNA ligase family protein [Selenomonadaceae bacterium]
ADFISEAVDQTRGWFYSLMAISTLIFDDTAFKNCIVLGLVLDKDGQKMSKSKGNAVAPMETLAKHGADAIRWYFYENSAPWLPNRFHDDAVVEGQRKFLGTLWNTYAFFVLYANIDDFDATKYTLEYDKLSVMDKWLLSRLNTMVKTVDDALTNYKVPESARALQDFVDELSNWYVRRSRARFWAKGMEQDKINAYMTLYTALVTLAKAAAPMVPFITENIYRNLVCSIDKTAPESVHLCDYPTADEKFIDAELERNMDLVLKIVVLGRAARNATNIKNRQPVERLVVSGKESGVSKNSDSRFLIPDPLFVEIVEDELNVKNVEFRADMSEFIKYNFKPNFRVLGKKVGKRMGEVQNALKNLDGAAAKLELDKTGELKLGDITLTAEDIEITITQSEGFNCQSDNDVSIAFSTTLTPALIEEGFVREIISKIQVMRRESNFEVTDRIKIFASDNEKLAAVITGNAEEIMSVTLADEIIFSTNDNAKEWDINGEKISLGVERI